MTEPDFEYSVEKDAEEGARFETPNENLDDPLDSVGSASKFSPQYLDEEYLQEADLDLGSTGSEASISVPSSSRRKVCICVLPVDPASV